MATDGVKFERNAAMRQLPCIRLWLYEANVRWCNLVEPAAWSFEEQVTAIGILFRAVAVKAVAQMRAPRNNAELDLFILIDDANPKLLELQTPRSQKSPNRIPASVRQTESC